MTQDLSQAGGVEVLAAAEQPDTPVAPNTMANVIVGGLIGLLAGIALAFALDRMDDSVRSKDDGGTSLRGAHARRHPQGDRRRNHDRPDRDREPGCARSRGLQAPAHVSTVPRPRRVDAEHCWSPAPLRPRARRSPPPTSRWRSRRATSGCCSIAADLRRPPAARDVRRSPVTAGSTSVLLGETNAASTVFAVDEVPGLHLMPPGPTPPNPAELLDSARTRDLVAALAEGYDTVIIDSPPVLPVTDAQVLSRVADGVLLVVAHGETSKRGPRASDRAPRPGRCASRGYGAQPRPGQRGLQRTGVPLRHLPESERAAPPAGGTALRRGDTRCAPRERPCRVTGGVERGNQGRGRVRSAPGGRRPTLIAQGAAFPNAQGVPLHQPTAS